MKPGHGTHHVYQGIQIPQLMEHPLPFRSTMRPGFGLSQPLEHPGGTLFDLIWQRALGHQSNELRDGPWPGISIIDLHQDPCTRQARSELLPR